MDDAPQFWAITNGTDRKITARFHGEDYVWQRDQEVTIAHEAAVHIFGVGQDDKTAALHRLGWLTVTADLEAALDRLRQLKFSPVRQVFEMAPARAAKRSRKVSSDRSLATADGSEGATQAAPEETDAVGEVF